MMTIMNKLFRICLITASAFAVVAALPQSAEAKSTKAERNLIKEGNKAFADSNFVDAFALYEQALQANPLSDAARYNKAVTLTFMSNEDNKGTANDPRVKAAEIFESVAKTSKDDALVEKSFYNLGNMAFRDGDYAAAIEQYKGALRVNPDNKKTRQNLRIAQLQQQQQDQNQDQNQDQQQNQNQSQNEDQNEERQDDRNGISDRNAEQILKAMENEENATRRKIEARRAQEEQKNASKKKTDKPW